MYKVTTNLRRRLHNYDPTTKAHVTDDRPPTFYFKVNTHKETFPSSATIYTSIYTFDPYAISPFVRPIANHSASITTLAYKVLRPLLTPIIAQHPLFAGDANAVIKQLSIYGPPPAIFHYDINPSLPHDLALEAFEHYFPTHTREKDLLAALISYNFHVSRDFYYHLGPIGISMGLLLAPEIARVVTAYQLDTRLDLHPPVATTLYFDNLYTTHSPEVMLPVFTPFIPLRKLRTPSRCRVLRRTSRVLPQPLSNPCSDPHPPSFLSPKSTNGYRI